eukprot:TRINITY_DN21204_c0_g1_i3.p1 TRINITY_DN21204_c0_g1~~TRINITY_DN21204_c0_g1_i3.p1  ORF type:complete len:437 (+),score=97.79 TRINITY_DN21204_c0_g1_i3:81-1313(+)
MAAAESEDSIPRGALVSLRSVSEWEWLTADLGTGVVSLCGSEQPPRAGGLWEVCPPQPPAPRGALRLAAWGTPPGAARFLAPPWGELSGTAADLTLSSGADGAAMLSCTGGRLAVAAGVGVFCGSPEQGDDGTDYACLWQIRLEGLPVVDVSPLLCTDSSEAERGAMQAALAAAGDVGFFGVVGHGLGNLGAELAAAARRCAESAAPRRSGDAPVTATLQTTTGLARLRQCEPPRPLELPGWVAGAAEAAQKYFAAADRVGGLLLSALAEAAGYGAHLAPYGQPLGVLRVLWYPPGGSGDGSGQQCTLASHTDKSWLTLLYQDGAAGALEVEGRTAGEWCPVAAQPRVVANVGDALQALTGGLFKSKVHRALGPPQGAPGRLSFPLFVEPSGAWPEGEAHRGTQYIVQEL